MSIPKDIWNSILLYCKPKDGSKWLDVGHGKLYNLDHVLCVYCKKTLNKHHRIINAPNGNFVLVFQEVRVSLRPNMPHYENTVCYLKLPL